MFTMVDNLGTPANSNTNFLDTTPGFNASDRSSLRSSSPRQRSSKRYKDQGFTEVNKNISKSRFEEQGKDPSSDFRIPPLPESKSHLFKHMVRSLIELGRNKDLRPVKFYLRDLQAKGAKLQDIIEICKKDIELNLELYTAQTVDRPPLVVLADTLLFQKSADISHLIPELLQSRYLLDMFGVEKVINAAYIQASHIFDLKRGGKEVSEMKKVSLPISGPKELSGAVLRALIEDSLSNVEKTKSTLDFHHNSVQLIHMNLTAEYFVKMLMKLQSSRGSEYFPQQISLFFDDLVDHYRYDPVQVMLMALSHLKAAAEISSSSSSSSNPSKGSGPNDSFMFAVLFQFHSYIQRKNQFDKALRLHDMVKQAGETQTQTQTDSF